MINILVEGMTSNKGGKESYIINAYKTFDKTRFNFTFIAYDDEVAYEDYLVETGAVVLHLPSRNQGLLKFRKSLRHLFETKKYDVLWSHKTTLSSCEALEIANEYKVPLRIIHSHSSSNMGGKLTYILHQINKRRIKKWANEYYACSDTAAQWFFGEDKCKIIKNGIDVEKFRFNSSTRDRIRKRLGIDDCFVIGHIGRFGIEKNHKKLIDVFYEITKMDSSARLVLCGDGEERSNIEAHIREKELEDRVILLGVIDNVHEVLQAIDIIVMPSLFEGLPFALLEAQAAGLKCIVSDTVSKESDILRWNTFVPLASDDYLWAKTVVGQKLEDRKKAADTVKSKGFDIHDCVDEIEGTMELAIKNDNDLVNCND